MTFTRHWLTRTFHVKTKMSKTLYSYGTAEQVASIIKTEKPSDCASSRARVQRIRLKDVLLQGLSSMFEVITLPASLSVTTTLTLTTTTDNDFIGGQIPRAIHIPSVQLVDKLDGLVERLKDTKTVVFHCMLSREFSSSIRARPRC